MRRVALLLLLLFSVACRQQVSTLAIQNAELELPGTMPTAPLALNGEWLFFPSEFLDPDHVNSAAWPTLQARARHVILPSQWNTWGLPAHGYGTFLLRIQGLDRWSHEAIRIPPILTSSRAYLKDADKPSADLLAVKGTVASSAEHFVPFEQQEIVGLHSTAPVNFLVIHVSNFQLRKGGMNQSVLLGDLKTLVLADKTTYGMNLWLIGAMMAICVYNIFLYINRPEDSSALALASFSLVIVSRLITTENVLEYWVGQASWLLTETRYKIEYGSIILCPITLTSFLRSNFPERFSARFLRVTIIVTLLQFIPILVLPSSIYTPYLPVFQMVLLAFGFYNTWCGIQVMRHRDPEWQYLAIGGYPFFASIVLDILVSRGVLPMSNYTVQYVMVWFTMTQSHVLGKRFASAFRTAQHLSQHLQNEVEEQTAEIAAQSRSLKAILDNVPVGVFTISSPALTIDPNYSQHMNRIFATDHIAHRPITEVLLQDSMLDADEIAQIENILMAVMHESELNFTVNEETLCRELIKKVKGVDRILSISWVPIADEQAIVRKMLVTVHDISEIRQLARESQERMDHLNRIAEILAAGKERMQNILLSTRRLLAEAGELTRERVSDDTIKTLFINLHTIKGNSRQLHLRQLTEAAHRCEAHLHRCRQDPMQWQATLMENFLDELQQIVNGYEHQLQTLQLQSHLELQVREEGPRISPILQKAWHQQGLPLPDQQTLIAYAATTLGVPLREVLEFALSGLNTLARDLGKEEPRVEIRSAPIVVTRSTQEILQNILVHILRNAMDHGIEIGDERIRIGKDAQGKIQIDASVAGAHLALAVRDDGRGLDMQRLRTIVPNASGRLQDLAQHIFDDGVSTARSVTEISGRGVGMAAIKRHIEEAGGRVELVLGEPNSQGFCPFSINFRLPESSILWADIRIAQQSVA